MTRKVMDRLPLTFVFNDPDQNDVAMLDRATGEIKTPRTDKEQGLVSDQGIVIRASNPFNGERQILILAGSYGYGSTAAARLVTSSRFLRNSLARSRKNFEVLFTTEVVEHAPQEAVIQEMRELRVP